MFRFKLEALLNHHRHQEDACQKALAQAERNLADKQAKLLQQKTAMRDQVLKLRAKQGAGFNVTEIKLCVDYIQQLSQEIEAWKISVRDAAKQVKRKRSDLIRIVKKRKTIEKLKEKQIQAHNLKIMQAERKRMDEAGAIRHARKN
jgi:flagellar FliJ protein